MANKSQSQPIQSGEQNPSNGSMLGGVTDKLSSAVGGGQGSGDNQSYLSKGELTTFEFPISCPLLTELGIDAVQQSVYGQGNQPGAAGEKTSGMSQERQDVHSAVDQAHPEQISEFLRDKYYSRTEEQEKEEGRG